MEDIKFKGKVGLLQYDPTNYSSLIKKEDLDGRI